MKNFISTGDIVEVIAPSDVSSGDIVVVGKFFGIALTNAVSGAPVNIQTNGVYNVAKTSAQAWTQGAPVYATSAGLATTTATDNTFIGHAVAAAANPSGTGRIRLSI